MLEVFLSLHWLVSYAQLHRSGSAADRYRCSCLRIQLVDLVVTLYVILAINSRGANASECARVSAPSQSVRAVQKSTVMCACACACVYVVPPCPVHASSDELQ
jgi:hypothetical protein